MASKAGLERQLGSHALAMYQRETTGQRPVGYASLPNEILLLFFERLPIPDVVACQSVCRSWLLAGRDEQLWAKLIRILPKNGIQAVEKENPPLHSYLKVIRYFESCVGAATNAMHARSPFLYRNECRGLTYLDIITRQRDVVIVNPQFAAIEPMDVIVQKINDLSKDVREKYQKEMRYHVIANRGRTELIGTRRNMLIFPKDLLTVIQSPTASLKVKTEAIDQALETLVIPETVSLTSWSKEQRYTYILFMLMKSYAESTFYDGLSESEPLSKHQLLQIVEVLLIRGANPNADSNDFLFFDALRTRTFNIKCSTAFQMAIALDWVSGVALFLKYNADPNKATVEELDPIDIALFLTYQSGVLALLISRGANAKKHVEEAIRTGSTRILQNLLTAGADISGIAIE